MRKQYYLHTVVRMDKYQNSFQCSAFQKSHDLNKKVFWSFLPFQLEWIKVDLVVFWHADAYSQPQSVIREGRHGATDILTWHPGRVEVDINSSEFLESNVAHPVYCSAFQKRAVCLTAHTCCACPGFHFLSKCHHWYHFQETISLEWTFCELNVTWRPAFCLMSCYVCKSRLRFVDNTLWPKMIVAVQRPTDPT
jgi:hypothetical protein